MFSGNRDELRDYYFSIWEKYLRQEPLDALSQQILQVILEHPEYHYCFQDPGTYKRKNYSSDETNPFLHMALHLSIREQVATDRPQGIAQLYERYTEHFSNEYLTAEHEMLAVLANVIWDMQQHYAEFNEADYLHQLRHRLRPKSKSAANETW
jgi:Domain of unknown function (DUF1841)